ncbi:RNA polymerase sigma factor [Flagellimonas sp. HMM57]|uniref:RNA polymerase sigma factor n=1 Tax=unclassified Flagellimonas TaxID=2644544 RepID=UPI001969AA3A|nr:MULTISPECIES: RNA polymerase sigma factor [unclassified Flagellimonas]UII75846.1 RNA polymerase sigma factor [Flagellimonas sp. HMM57]
MIGKRTVKRCLKGNRKAQKLLYDTYAEKMFVHCYRYVKQKEDAEEIVSEGFVKVFSNLSKIDYRDAQSFEGWVKRIMINECLMFLRKKDLLVFDKMEMTLAETTLKVEGILEADDIYALIVALPVGYRTVFNLYSIEGFSHKEIAQKLGIKESTSRSQLAKGRGLLKTLMAKTNI